MKRPGGWASSLSVSAFAIAHICGCGPRAAPPATLVPLHLEPACDLAPSATLAWLVEVKPRAIAGVPDLIPAIAPPFPQERLTAFSTTHGGIDVRQMHELCVAHYTTATLYVARVPFDPDKVADAFERQATKTVTRTRLETNPSVVRFSQVSAEPVELVTFGRQGLALDYGKPAPLHAAEAFAFGRLKKSLPALRGSALKQAAEYPRRQRACLRLRRGAVRGRTRSGARWTPPRSDGRGRIGALGGNARGHRGSRRAHRRLGARRIGGRRASRRRRSRPRRKRDGASARPAPPCTTSGRPRRSGRPGPGCDARWRRPRPRAARRRRRRRR